MARCFATIARRPQHNVDGESSREDDGHDDEDDDEDNEASNNDDNDFFANFDDDGDVENVVDDDDDDDDDEDVIQKSLSRDAPFTSKCRGGSFPAWGREGVKPLPRDWEFGV